MTQTLEEGMKNQSKCIKVPREIRPYWAFDKAQEVNSNSQLYKQAGNSVTVNVIAAIAKELS